MAIKPSDLASFLVTSLEEVEVQIDAQMESSLNKRKFVDSGEVFVYTAELRNFSIGMLEALKFKYLSAGWNKFEYNSDYREGNFIRISTHK